MNTLCCALVSSGIGFALGRGSGDGRWTNVGRKGGGAFGWDQRHTVRGPGYTLFPLAPRLTRRYVRLPGRDRLLHRQARLDPDPQRAAPRLRCLLLPLVPRGAARGAARCRGREVRLLLDLAGRGSAVYRIDTGGRGGGDCLPGDPGSVRKLPAGCSAGLSLPGALRMDVSLRIRRHGGADNRDLGGGVED